MCHSSATRSEQALGVRFNIPHLWAYFLLGQILPGSFAQNLFFTAILLSPKPSVSAVSQTLAKRDQALLVILFYTTLMEAPKAVQTPLQMPTLLATRALLVSPYFILRSVKSVERQAHSQRWYGTFKYSACLVISGLILFLPIQTWRVQSHVSIIQAICDSRAVSALAYDYVLGVGSFVLSLHQVGDIMA